MVGARGGCSTVKQWRVRSGGKYMKTSHWRRVGIGRESLYYHIPIQHRRLHKPAARDPTQAAKRGAGGGTCSFTIRGKSSLRTSKVCFERAESCVVIVREESFGSVQSIKRERREERGDTQARISSSSISKWEVEPGAQPKPNQFDSDLYILSASYSYY